ncbi:hypothetical protein P154DRAFT_567091 [Amniculicola lignicola CBS 123094]|uniref:F-box domain-containing protein n=1 Tax=Amniculicola lignicola CBS 123094 TaxID=1392246 RepID=A0A6A5VZA7_9PLEO|nr:hypothetical protein P154DRAFT_567091 [Amniculicola lignicola CBS 123094]
MQKTSLQSLPPEIRLEIWTQLLTLNSIPRSFGYTSPYRDGLGRTGDEEDDPSLTLPPLRTHAMILASRQLSAEYRQAYYERTNFFLRVDSTNAFRTLPQLASSSSTTPSLLSATSNSAASSLPNFWNAPVALLSSLRHCTLYVEIGDIACAPPSVHSAAGAVRALRDPSDGRRAMMNFSSYEELKAGDAPFDSTLLSAVIAMLAAMKQLRSIIIVWETSTPLHTSPRLTPTRTANWTWPVLGKPVVDTLRMRACAGALRKWQVQVGDRYADTMLQAEKGEGGLWNEKGTGLIFTSYVRLPRLEIENLLGKSVDPSAVYVQLLGVYGELGGAYGQLSMSGVWEIPQCAAARVLGLDATSGIYLGIRA